MIAILGGAGAALAWALSTLCSSRSSRLIDPLAVVAWVMLVGLVITAPVALTEGIPDGLGGGSGAWLAVSGAGNVLGLALAYAALRVGQVALVAPLISTEGVIAALIAVAAGERLAASVALTLVAIGIGVCMAASPAAAGVDSRAPHGRAVTLAMLAACSFGLSLYATGRAGSAFPSGWVVLAARAIGAVAVALPLLLTRRLVLTRAAVPLVLASGVCEVLGFYSYIAGARHGLAVAAVISSQFAVLAAVGGYLLFRERLSRIQFVGVGTVLVGVAALSALRA